MEEQQMDRVGSPRDNRVDVLVDCTKLAKHIVRECQNTKLARGTNLWVFSLLAKLTTTATSVQILIREKCLVDTKILLRSMLDAMIDLVFLLEGPLNEKQLLKLFDVELHADQYERFKFEADRSELTLEEWVAENPQAMRAIEVHDRMPKKKPPIGADRDKFGNTWKQRWRYVTAQGKLEHLESFAQAIKLAQYGIRHLGIGHAHCRPVALHAFIQRTKGNRLTGEDLRFVVNPKPREFIYSEEWIAFEAALCILISCDRVIDNYYLSSHFTKKLQKLVDRLRELSRSRRRPIDAADHGHAQETKSSLRRSRFRA